MSEINMAMWKKSIKKKLSNDDWSFYLEYLIKNNRSEIISKTKVM